jgi:UDP-N-acetylmuramoyl-tripeptide--D-alanyl-D-alanine ligase
VRLTAGEIAAATTGSVVAGAPDVAVVSFTMDSRVLHPGQGFVALRGVRDGHDFVVDAVERGAALVVVERRPGGALPDGVAVVQVDDALAALAAMARLARAKLADATVVAVTGSAGKTSTKDLVAAALVPHRRVHASPGSFNNESGLPLTLVGAPADTEVLVVEMGARFAGNIAELAEIARPEIGVVTQVGLAHAEHLGGRAGIAATKGELVEALPASGLAVLNHDCDAFAQLAARTRARVLGVGSGPGAEVRLGAVTLDHELRPSFGLRTPWGRTEVALNLRGEHQAMNAAMAISVAAHVGVPLAQAAAGVAHAVAAPQRMELHHHRNGITVLNDAYNSNPTSAASALEALAALAVTGRRIAVLGEMRELGAQALEEHERLGAIAARLGIDLVVAVGTVAESIASGARRETVTVISVPDAEAAGRVLVEEIGDGDAVLVKASRAVGLERVAEDLFAETSSQTGAAS